MDPTSTGGGVLDVRGLTTKKIYFRVLIEAEHLIQICFATKHVYSNLPVTCMQ